MQPAKVKVLVCLFAYSGNGGIPGTIPEIAIWLAKTYHAMKADPRIETVGLLTLCDTPITMTRNRAIKVAQEGGFDMVLMLDSDNEPDGYVKHDSTAKPFWDVAFTHAYERLLRGLPTAIAAPYCGPPPHPLPGRDGGEVPYLLEWENNESDVERPAIKLRLLTRNEAFRMKGIHPVAALPTGVCLFTINCFEGMKKPYFDYTFSADGSEKETTEDIFCTRNISLFWAHKIGENVVFAACDSWALHHKVKKVGRPNMTTVEAIAEDFAQAVRENRTRDEVLRDMDFTGRLGESISEAEAEAITHELHRQTFPKPAPQATGPEDPTDTEDGDLPADDDSETEHHAHNGNGKPKGPSITYQMVSQRKVAIIGEPIGDIDLSQIFALGEWTRQHGGTRAIVVNAWTGQAAAALAPNLSTYCLDSYCDMHGGVARQEFDRTFKGSTAVRRVDGDPLQLAKSLDRQGADLILFDFREGAAVTADLLEAWYQHLAPTGVIAGRGYDEATADVKFAVMQFADLHGMTTGPNVLEGSTVWAIRAQELARAAESKREPATANT